MKRYVFSIKRPSDGRIIVKTKDSVGEAALLMSMLIELDIDFDRSVEDDSDT